MIGFRPNDWYVGTYKYTLAGGKQLRHVEPNRAYLVGTEVQRYSAVNDLPHDIINAMLLEAIVKSSKPSPN